MRNDERRLPQPPTNQHVIPNAYKNGKTVQKKPPKAPLRAITIKGNELRAAIRNGKPLDWSDLHERFVDLWQEARLYIWRAKHSKAGVPQWDAQQAREVLTFTADEKQVLAAIDTTRGILDSMTKLRREMGQESTGIPRWAIEKIERALRDYPEAQQALLKELAAEDDRGTKLN